MATSPLLLPAERPEGIPDPYRVYLARFTTPESCRTMRIALDGIVAMVLEDGPGVPEERVTAEDRPWWLLRYEDTMHIRDLLIARYRDASPVNVNKKLSALRGVLEECWNLDLMSSDDYLHATRELKTLPVGERA